MRGKREKEDRKKKPGNVFRYEKSTVPTKFVDKQPPIKKSDRFFKSSPDPEHSRLTIWGQGHDKKVKNRKNTTAARAASLRAWGNARRYEMTTGVSETEGRRRGWEDERRST